MGNLDETGERLLSDIGERQLPPGTLGLWWLGQSSFVIKGAGMIIYIDPYLAPDPERIVPPPLRPEQITHADLILCTHDHIDHIDAESLPVMAQASPQARILVPAIARDKLVLQGIEPGRVIVPEVDQPLHLPPLSLTAIPSAHEGLDYSPKTGYPYLGYILTLSGVTLYHSGDCVYYEGLLERLQSRPIDLALLPINGHDWKRLRDGYIGNFTYREAGDLAAAAGVDTVIPMHYGMFEANTTPPGYFVDYMHQRYPEQKIHIMARYGDFVFFKG